MAVYCHRLDKVVSVHECVCVILGTKLRGDLVVCRQCRQGKTLMAECPFRGHEEPKNNSMALAAANRALPLVLEYVLPRYPGARCHSVSFLALVAEGQFGFKGGAEALENVARTSGLCLEHLKGRYFVVIDNAARQLAGL